MDVHSEMDVRKMAYVAIRHPHNQGSDIHWIALITDNHIGVIND
jgi:hypothetical protein